MYIYAYILYIICVYFSILDYIINIHHCTIPSYYFVLVSTSLTLLSELTCNLHFLISFSNHKPPKLPLTARQLAYPKTKWDALDSYR